MTDEEAKKELRKLLGSKGKPLPNIFKALRVYHEIKDKYENREDILKFISYKINESIEEIDELLEISGIYIKNDSETALSIKKFVDERKNISEKQIIEEANGCYCLPYYEVERLVKLFLKQ